MEPKLELPSSEEEHLSGGNFRVDGGPRSISWSGKEQGDYRYVIGKNPRPAAGPYDPACLATLIKTCDFFHGVLLHRTLCSRDTTLCQIQTQCYESEIRFCLNWAQNLTKKNKEKLLFLLTNSARAPNVRQPACGEITTAAAYS